MKLGTNIYPVSRQWHCGKGFQGQRAKFKAIAKPNALCSGGNHFDGVTSRLTCLKSGALELFW